MLICPSACTPEEKVVRYKPFLSGIPDAKTGMPVVTGPGDSVAISAEDTDNTGIIKNRDGSTTLVTKSVRQLMRHLERTLDDGKQDEIIFDQLIAEDTKQYIRSQNTDPREYVAYLHNQRREIALFFARLPVGEGSPNAVFEPTGNKQYVVRLTGAAAKGLRFTKLWVALEKGNFKLLWLS